MMHSLVTLNENFGWIHERRTIYITGILMSRNVNVWFILMDIDNAKTPAIVIWGLRDKSKRAKVEFSGKHSANAIAELESNSVPAKLNSRKKWFLDKAVLIL